MSARVFEDAPAVRTRVPLLIGLMGPSGGGKTFSALRLATGIQKVTGGDIFVIDTEARRALHYADRFRFRHVPFAPPFGPLDYLSAIEHCSKKGAGVVIVDSMSHEHEGPGGVLEMHEAECERLLKSWKNATRETVQMSAWAKPKQERRRMINTILQMPANFIFCFRAKQKVKLSTKQQRQAGEEAVSQLGFMPIAGEEFVFEMTVNCLLMPGADGVPTWQTNEAGEKQMIKLPQQFRAMLLDPKAGPLSEATGTELAVWASGEKPPTDDECDELVALLESAESFQALETAAASGRSRRWTKQQNARIRAVIQAQKTKFEAATTEGGAA